MASTRQHFFLNAAHFRLDGGAMFGIIPRPMWMEVAPPDELNRINLALRLWLIKEDDRIILVDTGIGDYQGENFEQRFDVRGPRSPLEHVLKEIGLDPLDITDVICSHLHFDHVGGIAKKEGDQLLPVFINATVHLHRQHYEYAHHPSERDAGSFHAQHFDPIFKFYSDRGHITWHEGEEGVILALKSGDIRYKCSHGHTPFLMHPYDQQYIYMADLIPTSHHVHIPWVMGYDISPGVSVQEKRAFLDFILEKNLKAIYEHDPLHKGSSIRKNERGHYTPYDFF